MDGGVIGQAAVNAISLMSIYALVAVGITVVFGHTRLINFAHGQLLTLGAYIAITLTNHSGWWFAASVVIAGLSAGIVSLVLERTMFRFTVSNPVAGFLISLGLVFILENVMVQIWGQNPRELQAATRLVWDLGSVRVSAQRVIICVATLAIFALAYFLFTRTSIGLAIRAASMDREALSLTGAPVARLVTATFVAGGVLAGVAGAFVGSISAVTPFYGLEIVIKGFTIAIVGGLGNVKGALVIALLFGLGESFATTYGLASWVDALTFGVLIVMMVVRPRGLFGGAEGQVA